MNTINKFLIILLVYTFQFCQIGKLHNTTLDEKEIYNKEIKLNKLCYSDNRKTDNLIQNEFSVPFKKIMVY